MPGKKINDTVLEFINSRDVREYLRKEEYEFKPLEAAWLIGQSVFKNIEEKHEAYRLLMESTEDFMLPKILFVDNAETSFHEFLAKLIDWGNQFIKRFRSPEGNCIFTYRQRSKDNARYFGDNGYNGYFTSFENALKDAHDFWEDYEVDSFCFMKYDADTDTPSMLADTDYAGNIIDITEWGENASGIKYNLDQIYYDIPVPFKRGDILCRYDQHNGHWYNDGFGPVVVESVAERRPDIYCDSSDMVVYGMMQIEETGHIYHEVCSQNFMDLEYYRGELTGARRILKTVSSFLKEEIPLDLFANAYAKIIIEEHSKSINPSWYLEEYIERAGLMEKKDEQDV